MSALERNQSFSDVCVASGTARVQSSVRGRSSNVK